MRQQLDALVEFHRVFGAHSEETPTVDLPDEVIALRVSLIQEELNEYRHAAETHDLVEVADALSDLMYVVLGTYVSHGLQDLAEALFAEVHRSNMSKLDANGQVIYRADGKVLKSNRWRPPDLRRDPGGGKNGAIRGACRMTSNQHPASSIQQPAMSKQLYIAYTGGTIGMQRTVDGYAPAPGFLAAQMAVMPELADPRMPGYDIHEYDPLLDSSNMRPADWVRIGQDIVAHYDAYDGFIVLHGTDTMAYTASALPFFLQGLRKPVIVTGSQIPLCEIRNDARANLITSMLIAAEYPVPEVCLYFSGKLLRGCRAVKVDADGLEAFDSPKFPPLGVAGVEIQIDLTRVHSPRHVRPRHGGRTGRRAAGRVPRCSARRGHGRRVPAISGAGARSAAERASAAAPGTRA